MTQRSGQLEDKLNPLETAISEPNPFEAPQKFIREALKTDRLLLRGFLTVAASAFFFGLFGGIAGLLIGMFLPDFFLSIFRSVDFDRIEPWKMGMGLGVTQGLVAGAVVGCVVLLSTAWYKSRMNNSMVQMMAQIQALQATSPEVELQDEVDLTKLTKTKSN